MPYKIDFCYAVNHIEESLKNPLMKEFKKIADDSLPGFIRPCPWKVCLAEIFQLLIFLFAKEISASNVTLKTNSLTSIWPTGDYKVFYRTFAGTSEDFLNITLIGSFRTPLKESFG